MWRWQERKKIIESSNLWPNVSINKFIDGIWHFFPVCAQVINIFRFSVRLGIWADCGFWWMRLLPMQKFSVENLNELHVLCIILNVACARERLSERIFRFRYRRSRLKCAITYLACLFAFLWRNRNNFPLSSVWCLSPLFGKIYGSSHALSARIGKSQEPTLSLCLSLSYSLRRKHEYTVARNIFIKREMVSHINNSIILHSYSYDGSGAAARHHLFTDETWFGLSQKTTAVV